MLKTILKRGLILGLIIVAVALVGGISALDLPIILILALLVVVLGIASYIAHNHNEKE